MEIKGILFDKDGTLIDFFEAWGKTIQPVIRKILEEAKIDKKEELLLKILNHIGVYDSYIDPEGSFAWKPYEQIAEDISVFMQVEQKQLSMSTKEIQICLSDFFQQEQSRQSIPQLTDLKELMDTLNQMGFYTGIATTDEYEATLECIEKCNIKDNISFYGTAGREMPVKPDARLLHQAADHWKIQPKQIIVVGDTPNDMRFAKNAGAIAVGVLSGTGRRKDLEQVADYIIDSVKDFVPLLLKLQSEEK